MIGEQGTFRFAASGGARRTINRAARKVGFDLPIVDEAVEPLRRYARQFRPGTSILLIDASHAAYRAFHTRDLSSPDGAPTSVLHGLLSMTQALCAAAQTTRFLLVWDGSVRYKRAFFPGYKIRHERQRTPEEAKDAQLLREAMELARNGLALLGFPQLEPKDIECDDAIGLCCTMVETAAWRNGYPDPPLERAIVVSDDKDFYQLVGQRVVVWRGIKSEIVGPSEFVAKFGFPSCWYVDYKALVGESAAGDNIPGVAKVGDVTAAKLVAAHGSLESVIEAARAACGQPGARVVERNIAAQAATARLSRTLSRITRNVDDLRSWKLPDQSIRGIVSVVREAMAHAASPWRRVPAQNAMRVRTLYGFARSLDFPRITRDCGLSFVGVGGEPVSLDV